ncbi:hypothetical protein AVU38_gp032 [Ralstonia phage RSL2]|uniref:Uncharacterized protein n=1 Tax=Ralstonia phage RSL2 TaxID=1585840 RepID=A0A0A8J843_9CAUD|nr:hypothetical protein AVU38_gp032 [Ralstonia phage RSL2]BAQ02560.1 hypothetical protein [Ralstonia phage RSL2]
MTKGATSGIIKFLDNEYTIEGLEKAIGKSNATYIEPASPIHELVKFDQAQLPADWKDKYKMPIVTQREGKYVFIFMPDADLDFSKGFKAKFVTKYNLNQAKPYVAPPPSPAPVVEAPKPYEKKSYGSKSYQGSGGYNNNRNQGGRWN